MKTKRMGEKKKNDLFKLNSKKDTYIMKDFLFPALQAHLSKFHIL